MASGSALDETVRQFKFGEFLSLKNAIYKHELDRTPCYNSTVECVRSALIFDNLPDLITPDIASRLLNRSIATLYDWNYRGKTRKRKIPSNLFTKVGGGLYLRKDVLLSWIMNRSSS